MKFIALVEYDYPVLHKPPVKAELVLHGDRVETENVKIIAVINPIKKYAWYPLDEFPHEVWECGGCREKIYTEDLTNYQYCPKCGGFMINGGDTE